LLSRRQFVGAVLVGFGTTAHADDTYVVPGGRIGFRRPAELKPLTNSWHLLSRDQTLQVEIREAMRIDAIWDRRIWEQDGRHALVDSYRTAPNIECRRFRDQRYGDSPDYGADVYAFRDDSWLGQVRIYTSTLGAPRRPGTVGQIERWQGVADQLAKSVAIRPMPSVSQALAEHRIGLAVEDLNPRLSGDRLILSLAPPTGPLETSGVAGSHIDVLQLALLPLGAPQELERLTNQAFDIYRGSPGSRVVAGTSCRAVVLAENASAGARFLSTTAMAFGRTRQLKLTASYDAAARAAILQALEGLFSGLSLPDAA